MTDVINLRVAKKVFTVGVVAATILWSIGIAAVVPLSADAAPASGDLVKASQPAVYYVGADGKRYVFPNEKTYKSWYPDFSTVKKITDAELAALLIGGNVTYRPGVKLVKITTDPTVYAVTLAGLVKIPSEAVAAATYGADWNKQIDDVPDAFFTNYKVSADVCTASSGNVHTAATPCAKATLLAQTSKLGDVVGGSTVTPPAAASLSVSLASDNPAAQTVISDGTSNVAGSQADVTLLKLRFTGAGKVTQLKLKRTGISTDSDFDNFYLLVDGMRIEMSSLSLGTITFSNSSGLFTVNGTTDVRVTADIDAAVTAGKTLGLELTAATDITSDVASVGGTFPVSGNLATSAVVGDFGRLTLAGLTNAASVDPGTADFRSFRFTLASANQQVNVSKLKVMQLGSINATDLENIKLYEGATELASVAALDADKNAVFSLAKPLEITAGVTKTLEIGVTVKAGSTRTIQWSFQKSSSIEAIDSNYKVALRADTALDTFAVTNSTAATVNSGSLTITLATDSPSGNVALNGTNVLLAKYNFAALGEPIKVNSLSVTPSSDSFAGATNWTNIRNLRLTYDGAQVGTTSASIAEDVATSINVSFVVPAGTTKIVEIRADVAAASGAANAIVDTETVRVRLNTGTDNAQRTNSLGTINAPGANTAGNNLTATAGSLTVTRNQSEGDKTVVNGATNVLLASHLVTAGASEGVDVTGITYEDGNTNDTTAGTSALGAAFDNLKVFVNDVQFGQVKTTSTSDAATLTYTFNGVATIPAGTTVRIDVRGDVRSSSTWTNGEWFQFDSATGTGKVTSSAANVASANASRGQGLTISAAGTLTVSVDSSTPAAKQILMGSLAQTLSTHLLAANTVEDLTVSQIIITNTNSGGTPNGRNFKLYALNAAGVLEQQGSTIPALDASNQAAFRNLNIVVSKGSQKAITVKADGTPFSEGASAGSQMAIRVSTPASITGASTEPVIARGAGAYAALANASTNYDANAQYPYRTLLSLGLSCPTANCIGTLGRGNGTVPVKVSLTASAGTDAQMRSALQANDEADGGAGGNDWKTTVQNANAHAVAASATQKVDGTNSIAMTATTDFDANDTAHFDFGASAGLNNYSRASVWVRSTRALTSGDDLTFFVNDDDDGTTSVQSSVALTAMSADTWYYFELTLSGLNANSRYVGLRVDSTGELATGDTIFIDNLRLWNDKALLNFSGDFAAIAAANGTEVLLRDAGGATKAVGYWYGTSTSAATVSFHGGADIGNAVASAPAAGLISVGSSPQTYDVVLNSGTVLAAASSGIARSFNTSFVAGTASSAGDSRWYDQAVTATSPITWMNGQNQVVNGSTPQGS